jgi:hypothetical protein
MLTKALFGKVLIATLAGGILASSLPLAASAGEVANRVENQQARIAAGVHNGQLSPREYVNDEAHLRAINAQRRLDLARNGGHLTAYQKAQLNRELNNNSARIYRTKHN